MDEETRAPFPQRCPVDTGHDKTRTNSRDQDSLEPSPSTPLLAAVNEDISELGGPKIITNCQTCIKTEADSNGETPQTSTIEEDASVVQTGTLNLVTTFQTCIHTDTDGNSQPEPQLSIPRLGTVQGESVAVIQSDDPVTDTDLVQTSDFHEVRTFQTCINIDTENDKNFQSEPSTRPLSTRSDTTVQTIHPNKDVSFQTCVKIDIENYENPQPDRSTPLLNGNIVAAAKTSDRKDSMKDNISSNDGSECPDESIQPSYAIPSTAANAEDLPWGGNSRSGREVVFLVGQGRQPMTGRDSELAAMSPVFRVMLADRWQKTESDEERPVEIPEADAESFGVIQRYASQAGNLQLSEENVWNVLKVADMYQVFPVVDHCFHFLLHNHPRHQRSHHICVVLEMAHQLNYTHLYEDCMETLKQKAGKVFKNASALSELCQQCMLNLVMSRDLAVPEILIHDAVVTWTRRACAKRGETTPSLAMLRTTAGQLVYHVRYLAIPRRSLKILGNRDGQISCLLTESEMCSLLNGDVRNFPETVDCERQNEHGKIPSDPKKKMDSTCTVLFLVGLFLLLLFAVLYIPIAYAVNFLGSGSNKR